MQDSPSVRTDSGSALRNGKRTEAQEKLFGEILKEGYLYKFDSDATTLSQATKKRDWKEYWCNLRAGIFSYQKSKQSAAPRGQIYLNQLCKIQSTILNEKFYFLVGTPQKIYFFLSKSQQLQMEWVEAIENAKISITGSALIPSISPLADDADSSVGGADWELSSTDNDTPSESKGTGSTRGGSEENGKGNYGVVANVDSNSRFMTPPRSALSKGAKKGGTLSKKRGRRKGKGDPLIHAANGIYEIPKSGESEFSTSVDSYEDFAEIFGGSVAQGIALKKHAKRLSMDVPRKYNFKLDLTALRSGIQSDGDESSRRSAQHKLPASVEHKNNIDLSSRSNGSSKKKKKKIASSLSDGGGGPKKNTKKRKKGKKKKIKKKKRASEGSNPNDHLSHNYQSDTESSDFGNLKNKPNSKGNSGGIGSPQTYINPNNSGEGLIIKKKGKAKQRRKDLAAEYESEGNGKILTPEHLSIVKWLEELKLPSNYLHLFTSDGFDDLDTIRLISNEELVNVGISKTGHRKRIMYWIAENKGTGPVQALSPSVKTIRVSSPASPASSAGSPSTRKGRKKGQQASRRKSGFTDGESKRSVTWSDNEDEPVNTLGPAPPIIIPVVPVEGLIDVNNKNRDMRTAYDLSRKDLVNVPVDVWNMLELEVLNMFQNKLELIPQEIGRLTKLKALGLNENSIRELPNQIGLLENLNVLDLRYNKLTELPPTIGRLTSLTRLFLRFNKLDSLPEEIGCLTSLEMLSVRNNELRSLSRGINFLKSLKILDLSTNHLTKIRSVAQLQQLKELDLKHNQLSDLPAGWNLQNLTRLDLSQNQFTKFPAHICELPNLQMLDMEGNNITSISPGIGRLSTLQKLYLNRNRIKSLPPEFGQLTSLKELYVKGNRLQSIPEQLCQLSQLKHLDLSTNKFVKFPNVRFLPQLVTSFDISDNEITELPKDICDWGVNMRQLNLEENQLSTLPPEIGGLKSLIEVRLGYNMLETIPDELGKLTLLKQIHLEHNKLVTLPKGVKTLSNVELMVLTDNLLDDLPNEMVYMTCLSELKVDGNPFGGFPTSLRDAGGRDTYNFIVKREAKARSQKKKK